MKDTLLKIWRFFSGNLILAVVAMIALGIIFGTFMPLWFVRIFTTFNAIFSSLLSFTVPLLILALVTVAIADTGSGAGKMLVLTVLLAYVSTVLAGMFTYGVSDIVFPKIVTMKAGTGGSKVIIVMVILFAVVLLAQYVIAGIISNRNPFKLLRNMLPALVTALALSSSAASEQQSTYAATEP